MRAKTGLKLDTYFSGSKTQMADAIANPEIREQLENGDALIGTIDTYLDLSPDEDGSVCDRPHERQSHVAVRYRPPALGRAIVLPVRCPDAMRWRRVRESFEQFGTTDADGGFAEEVADLRRDGRFAGVAVCARLF